MLIITTNNSKIMKILHNAIMTSTIIVILTMILVIKTIMVRKAIIMMHMITTKIKVLCQISKTNHTTITITEIIITTIITTDRITTKVIITKTMVVMSNNNTGNKTKGLTIN